MDILRHLLFENPLTLWIVLGLAAFGAGFYWSRTGSRRAAGIAAACLGAAVLVGLAAWLVETDRERLERTLDKMGDAAAAGDAEAFIERISREYVPPGKDALAGVVRRGLALVRVSAETPVIQMTGGEATVTQVYRFRPAPGSRVPIGQPFDCVTWEGTFAPDADGEWRLRSAVAVRPERLTPQDAATYLQRMR